MKIEAKFGLGYEISSNRRNPYLELLTNVPYPNFKVTRFTNSENEKVYIAIIKNPLIYGLDLTQIKKELEDFMEMLDLFPESEFSIFGGLEFDI